MKDIVDYRIFFKEMISFSSLRNPAILRFHGFSLLDFDIEYHPVVFTEFVDGYFLEDKIGNAKSFTSTQRYIILVGIANGMKYLHSKNIIHKNLTPSSIVLDEHMYPHIKYFPMQIPDTNEYTAPETINRKEFSFESDVYSFSMIAYELLTSTRPFDKCKTNDLIQKVCHEGERPEMKYIENETIRSLLQRCWSSEATKRPSFDIIFQEITKYHIMQSFKANKEEVEKYLCLFKHEEKVRNPAKPEENDIKSQSFDLSVNDKSESSDSNNRSDSIDNSVSNSIIIMRYLRSFLFYKESSLKKIRIENKSEMTGSLEDLKSKVLTRPNPNVLCYSVKYDSEYFVEYYDDQTPIQELPPYLNMQIKSAKGHDYRICILCDISKLQKQTVINDDFFSIAIDFVNYNKIDEFKQKIIDYLRLQSTLSIQFPDIYIFKNQTFERIIRISEIEDNKTPLFVSWNPEQFDQIKKYIVNHVLIQEGLNLRTYTNMKDNQDSVNPKSIKIDNYFESKKSINDQNSNLLSNDSHAVNESDLSDSNSRSESNENCEEDMLTVICYAQTKLFDEQMTKFVIENKTKLHMSLVTLKSKLLSNTDQDAICYSVKFDSEYFVEYYRDKELIHNLPPYLNIQVKPYIRHYFRICVLCDISTLRKKAGINDNFFSFAIKFINYRNIYEFKQQIIDYLDLESNQFPEIYIFKNKKFSHVNKIDDIQENDIPLFVSWNSKQLNQLKKLIVEHMNTVKIKNQESLVDWKESNSSKNKNGIQKKEITKRKENRNDDEIPPSNEGDSTSISKQRNSIDKSEYDPITVTFYARTKHCDEKTRITKIIINNKNKFGRCLGDLASKIISSTDSNVLYYSFKCDPNFSVYYYNDQTPIEKLPLHLNIQARPQNSDAFRIIVLCDKTKILNQTLINDEFFPVAIDIFPNQNIWRLRNKILDFISPNNSMKFDKPTFYIFKGGEFELVTDIAKITSKRMPLFASWSYGAFGRIREHIISQMVTQNET